MSKQNGVKGGRVVHYIFRGGKPNDMTSECGKSMETPAASYTTSRDKVTCRKCLKESVHLPDHGGNPDLTTRRYVVELEIDCNRGVVYAHNEQGISILRICGVPMNTMRGLARTPLEFIPQLDLTLRENLPALAQLSNLLAAKPEPETRKLTKKEIKAIERMKAKSEAEAALRKAKTRAETNRVRTPPKKKAGPAVQYRVYVDGKFKCYSEAANEKLAVKEVRDKYKIKAGNGVLVQARMTIKR